MSKPFILVQITDCHLFADKFGTHYGVNVYQNLIAILNNIKQLPHVDLIVFTGDLSQDHSEASYQLFVQAFKESSITVPVYYVAGNHDEPELLDRYLVYPPFCQNKVIETPHWQILLMASKSETPAGVITQQQLTHTAKSINTKKSQLLLMHHHSVDVGYFIDQHGLLNKEDLHELIENYQSIIAIGCGHVHQALTLSFTKSTKKLTNRLLKRAVPLYTCPATSIQFDVSSKVAKRNEQGAGFRVFTLKENKQFSTEVFFV